MAGRRPDFIIIGAMKCATSTLHEQLARRSGLYLSRPKEPNFFSDDDSWERGFGWYEGLFADASASQLCGESSTHYTKLPTYPETVDRLKAAIPEARLVYVMRDPVDRIVSQYVHEWSEGQVSEPIDRVVEQHERFVAYSCYARQLAPFIEAYGADAILPLAYERMIAEPDATLARVCTFIGDPTPGAPAWTDEVGRQNVSSERMRPDPLRDRVLAHPLGRALKSLMPKALKQRARAHWTMNERPELSGEMRARVEAALDADLARLGEWLDLPLDCRRWRELAREREFAWSPGARDGGV